MGTKKAVAKKVLQFLHNTNSEKLARIESMGGMPMPSIAVTKKDIPFEGFGDITMVGKPVSFDPKASKLNQVFSADAYTVRSPPPVRLARKGAGKKFQAKGGLEDQLKELGVYTDELSSNIWDLQKKGDIDQSKYNHVNDFFERNGEVLFLTEKGVSFNKDSRVDILNKMDSFREADELTGGFGSKPRAFTKWSKDKLDEIFEPEEYFISNPNRDYYTTRPKLKPYDAEEITKFMKKQGGPGGEGGVASKSAGAIRASTTEKLTSLKGMRDIQDRLVSADDMAEFKQTSGMMLDDLQEAFKPHYKYDSTGWGYNDEFNEFVKMSETMGVDRAAKEVGFDVPSGLKTELDEYKDMLRGGVTEYFESKPKRVVGMDEFGGAIIPQGTPKETIDLLEKAGIRTESYVDEAGRLAARDKFKEYMFQGAGAAVGLSAFAPEEASARANTFAELQSKRPQRNTLQNLPSYTSTQLPLLSDRIQELPHNLRPGLGGLETSSAPGWVHDLGFTLNKFEVPLLGKPLEGVADYLINMGYDDPAGERLKRATFAGLDLL